jgi:hypothetical protein
MKKKFLALILAFKKIADFSLFFALSAWQRKIIFTPTKIIFLEFQPLSTPLHFLGGFKS